MKMKIKVFVTVFMVVTLMLTGSAFAATSLVMQGNPTEFNLSDIAEEGSNGDKLWIKFSTVWDPEDSMYDATSLPEGTLALVATFEITDYDLGSSTMYWAGSIGGNEIASDIWDDTMPTDKITVDSDGTYVFVFDARKVFEGSLDLINSLQMVLPCKSADDALATTAKFKMVSAVAITDESEIDQYVSGKVVADDTSDEVTTDDTATDDAATDEATTDDAATDEATTSVPKTGESASSTMIYLILAITAASLGAFASIVMKKKNLIK